MMPVRVGLTPTFCSVRSEPGAMAAPTMRNAAEEMSPGTAMEVARNRWPPRNDTRAPSVSIAAPKVPSMRSV